MTYISNTFPTAIQSATDPISTDQVATFDHAGLETYQNDSIETLKTKIGVDGSAVTTSHDYKLGEVITTDKAVGKTATQTLTNKTLTAPKIANGGFIADANGNELIEGTTIASATNHIGTTNAATGNDPLIDAKGSDTNISLKIKAKGTGWLKLGAAELKFPNTDGGASAVLQTDGAGNLSFASASSDSSKTYTAGENLTVADAVFVSTGGDGKVILATSSTTSVSQAISTTTWIYQSFTTSANTTGISGLLINAKTNGGGTFTFKIRSSPTGSDLYSGTLGYGNNGNVPGNFSTAITPFAVSPSTTYYFIVIDSNSVNVEVTGGTTSSYSGGVSGRSTDSGANWTTPAPTVTGDFAFSIFEVTAVAGTVLKTDADNTTYLPAISATNNFIGFAKTTVLSGASVSVQIIGAFTGLTGLTVGSTYYLSNTAGAISTSAGTVSKKIGLSDSTTSIIIKHDN